MCVCVPQNNVLELWSLFDFLLPGFLGTERQFFERFGKPILLSRDSKSSSKELEAGDPFTHCTLYIHVSTQCFTVQNAAKYSVCVCLYYHC